MTRRTSWFVAYYVRYFLLINNLEGFTTLLSLSIRLSGNTLADDLGSIMFYPNSLTMCNMCSLIFVQELDDMEISGCRMSGLQPMFKFLSPSNPPCPTYCWEQNRGKALIALLPLNLKVALVACPH